jgi:hypothetical protein
MVTYYCRMDEAARAHRSTFNPSPPQAFDRFKMACSGSSGTFDIRFQASSRREWKGRIIYVLHPHQNMPRALEKPNSGSQPKFPEH